ncbi:MAG TPA: tripartite tricarboxylate transporter substrate binding protein [Burkholderiales bacterium]|nr:tripartite tricarboxylate transporter substrate binding protein [Burkholderiales bacterium]
MALLAALAGAPAVCADPYPSRPLRLVVPFPPGGGGDIVARIVASRFSETLRQQCVVDNRTGAAGNVGAEIVARAVPDGHTVFLGFNTVLTVNPLLYRLSFDMQKDLAPVVMMTSGQHMLVLHPSVKAGTLKELIALAKASPGSLNYASSGAGTPGNLAAELFKLRAGINLTHVPYRGGGPASVAVLAGEVQVLFGSLPSVFPQVRAGRLKALAVTGPKRAAAAPNLPTVAESGFPGFEVTNWHGLLFPAGTPEPVITVLHDEAVKALELPDVRDQIERQGLEVSVSGPREFAARIREETATWARVVEAAGIKPD